MSEQPPPQRQRVAAYGLLTRGDGSGNVKRNGMGDGGGTEILLARIAPHIASDVWALPGGGVDHGEHPLDALRREIFEETGLHAEPGRIVDVYSTHFTGARPDGLVEDYHGIGLIYEAEVLPQSRDVEPHVTDVGGSTDLAAWVPLADAHQLSLNGPARHALALLDLHQGTHETTDETTDETTAVDTDETTRSTA